MGGKQTSGVFVPLKVMVPQADIPTVAMYLRGDLDPAFHQRLGAALAPLRDDGILILGSGSSYHNYRGSMEWTMGPADTWDSLRAWLEGLIGDLLSAIQFGS